MKKNKGYIVITTVLFFLVISLAVIAGVVVPTVNHIKSVANELDSKQGYLVADTTNEEAYYRLSQGWTLPQTFNIPFSNAVLASAQVTVTGNQTEVTSTASNGNTYRVAKAIIRAQDVTGFNFAAQIGTGGISLSGGSTIRGSVYSNGSITGDSSGPAITGSVTVANTSPATINQTNSYTDGTSPVSVLTGKTSAAEDLSQSFKVTTSDSLSSIRFYVKKTGSPSNATIRIMPDLSGKPSNTGSLGTGTLTASTVTSSFTYVSVPITQPPTLTANTTYWVVIDVSSVSATNYFTFAATNNTYANGLAKSGKWSSGVGANTWSAVSPANSDLYFDIYLGGIPNTLSGSGQWNRISVGTDAWANQINSASVSGVAYCQTNTYLYNSSNSTKSCDTSRADAPMLSYPITDQNITDWKAIATAGGVVSSNYSVTGGQSVSLGPKKIAGNLSVSGGSTLYLTGTVWVTGSIDLSGGSVIKIASSYGTRDGMIIADGRIVVTGGAYMRGSGTSGSYMVAMTTSQCPTAGSCSGNGSGNAIDVEGGSGSVVMFAPYGTLALAGGGTVNSAVAKRLTVTGGSTVDYTTGLENVDFVTSSSTSNTGSLLTVQSWQEISN